MGSVTFKKGAKVKRWEEALNNPRKALTQIGALMVAESQLAFREQRLGKHKWDPRGEVNVFGIIADFHAGRKKPPQRRFQNRPALSDTGRLAASIAWRITSTFAVEVGSNLPYAAVHHRGGEVESKKITPNVRRLLWMWLRNQDTSLKRRLGFLFAKKFKNKSLKMDVPKRPIVAITRTLRSDVKKIIGVAIMETR